MRAARRMPVGRLPHHLRDLGGIDVGHGGADLIQQRLDLAIHGAVVLMGFERHGVVEPRLADRHVLLVLLHEVFIVEIGER